MKTESKEKGVKCKCGEFEPYPAYVYAHWMDRLIYTCQKCGTKYEILAGRAKIIP